MSLIAIGSAILGLASSTLPDIVAIFRKREEYKYEIALADIKTKQLELSSKHQLTVEEIRGLVSEGQSLRDHDVTLDGGKFINGLRASVRPIITYLFFLVFLTIKIATIYFIFRDVPENTGMLDMAEVWNQISPVIWGDSEQALFGAIMGFWFGSRLIQTLRKN